MCRPEMLQPLADAKRAFLAHQFSKVDQILPGLDSHIVLSYGVPDATVKAWVRWARKNRPCDLYFFEVEHD